MHIKQVCCAASVLTACLWAGWTTPAAAQLFGFNTTPATVTTAPDAAPGKPLQLKRYTKRGSRGSAQRKSRHTTKAHASKPAEDDRGASRGDAKVDAKANEKANEKVDAVETARTGTKPGATRPDTAKPEMARASSSSPWPVIPPSIANARAELAGGTADASAAFGSTPAASAAATPQTATVPAEAAAAAATKVQAEPVLASADATVPVRLTSATIQNDVAASRSEAPWSSTSLIGKIFIAFGSLLVFASAARLYFG